METRVLKFGGAAVETAAHFDAIAKIILEKYALFPRLVVVISAMGKTTDDLIDLAKQVHPQPPQREYDMLVSAGERISMALLAMALCKSNRVQAKSFTGSQSGIITCTNHANARIVDVRPTRILEALDQGCIAIVAGFQGMSLEKEVTTLGRGGSDTSAVALAVAVKAQKVEFLKDVEGICDLDPKTTPGLTPYSHLGYSEALAIIKKGGGKVLHPRAVELAARNGIALQVRSFKKDEGEAPGTWIFDQTDRQNSVPIYE